jgi:hypothetical protein
MPSAAGSFAIMLVSIASVPKSNSTSDTAANAFVIAVFAANCASVLISSMTALAFARAESTSSVVSATSIAVFPSAIAASNASLFAV